MTVEPVGTGPVTATGSSSPPPGPDRSSSRHRRHRRHRRRHRVAPDRSSPVGILVVALARAGPWARPLGAGAAPTAGASASSATRASTSPRVERDIRHLHGVSQERAATRTTAQGYLSSPAAARRRSVPECDPIARSHAEPGARLRRSPATDASPGCAASCRARFGGGKVDHRATHAPHDSQAGARSLQRGRSSHPGPDGCPVAGTSAVHPPWCIAGGSDGPTAEDPGCGPQGRERASMPRSTGRLARSREWWNGRHAGLRSRCRKAWGFESPLPHQHARTIRDRRRHRCPSRSW